MNLFQNPEFHRTVEELTTWLESTTDSIRSSEPVDLRVDRKILEGKLEKFRDLYTDLLRCEPRIVSLQEAADQLELQYDGEEDGEVRNSFTFLLFHFFTKVLHPYD
jgi:hypothetical protein